MKKYALLMALLLSYLAIMSPFISYMRNKPFLEKLGYTPEPGVLRLLSADQYRFVAATLLMKVTSYYGSLVEQAQNKVIVPPEYPEMQRIIESAVKLDPYNMDAYYFAQAIMVWDARQVVATNELLEYGMKFRDWDFYLPYFAGFNYAYFLKDYANAAKQYKQVADLTGDDLIIKLTGRYLYESGRTDLATMYLSMMVKNARNDAIKKSLQTRLQAFQEVRKIEDAAERFTSRVHRSPSSVEELLKNRYLAELPVDPYGGKFYIDDQGKVRSTSKFAFGVAGHTE